MECNVGIVATIGVKILLQPYFILFALRGYFFMNFVEFLEKVEQMKTELEEKGLDPKNVRVGYTRATGDNIIVAMSGDYTVASYFKW